MTVHRNIICFNSSLNLILLRAWQGRHSGEPLAQIGRDSSTISSARRQLWEAQLRRQQPHLPESQEERRALGAAGKLKRVTRPGMRLAGTTEGEAEGSAAP